MSDENIRDRVRVVEVERLIWHRYRMTPLPDDDVGREFLGTLVDHYVHLPNGGSRVMNFAEARAPWLTAAEVWEMVQASSAIRRRWEAEELGRALRLTFAERAFLRIKTIRAVDTPPNLPEVRRLARNERARQRRRRNKALKPPSAMLTARQRSIITTLRAFSGWVTPSFLRDKVALLPAWRDGVGTPLGPASLRRVLHRELNILISKGFIEEGDRAPTKWRVDTRQVRISVSSQRCGTQSCPGVPVSPGQQAEIDEVEK